MSKKWRLTDRTRTLLTLELAIVVPAAALMGFSIWNLKHIQRDKSVEAAIQRDFQHVLKIAERKSWHQANDLVTPIRRKFPNPDDGAEVKAKLENILRDHPEYAFAALYDKKSNQLVSRVQPGRDQDPVFCGFTEEDIKMLASWMPAEASSMAKRLRNEKEEERRFADVFPNLVFAMKYQGTTIADIGTRFLRYNYIVLGALSVLMVGGIWLTYRNVSREMNLARLKSDFVANVSHELRTPLALIRLYAETLELGRLTAKEKYQEYFRIIREESERLTALINNILDFSRIEAGRKEYEFKETNLADLVRSTLDSYRFQIEQNGFAFEENICSDIPPVTVDREAIARSLLNLVSGLWEKHGCGRV